MQGIAESIPINGKAKKLRVTTSRTYTLSMKQTITIHLAGVDKPVTVIADKIEQEGYGDDGRLMLIRDGQKVGEFKSPCVQGWWINSGEEDTTN